MSRRQVISHMNLSFGTHARDILCMGMSHVTHVNRSCCGYVMVMSHVWKSHVTHMNESCHICRLRATSTVVTHMQHTATHCDALQHSAIHCNALQHSAAHCDTLQHTQAHSYRSCSNPFRDLQSKPLTLQHTHAGSKLPQLFKPFLRSSVEATVKQYKNYLSSKLMSVSDEQNTKTQQTHTHTHTYGNR